MKKALSIYKDPGLSTECYHNFRLSLLLSKPGAEAWQFSHYMNLKFTFHQKDTFPMIRLEEHLDIYSEVMQEEHMRIENDLIQQIKNSVDNNEYIVIYLNWKNIKGSAFYKQTNMYHEAIIYGYDDTEKTFDVIAFSMNNIVYGTAKIPYEECEREFYRLCTEDMQKVQWFTYYGFPISRIKLKNVDYTLDKRKLYFSLDRGNVKAELSHQDSFAVGYYVADALAQFFKQQALRCTLLPSDYELWNILIYKLLQHNRLMKNRLQYMQALGDTSFQHLAKVEKYLESNKKIFSRVRSLSLNYQRNNKTEDLERISEEFKKAYNYDKRIYSMLQEYLVQIQLSLF